MTVPALPSLWGPHDEINHHLRRYPRSTLVGAVRGAGFGVERVTYFNTLLLPLGWLERSLARRRPRPSAALWLPPQPLNRALQWVFGLELHLLRWVDLPIGMSLLLVATPVDGGGEAS